MMNWIGKLEEEQQEEKMQQAHEEAAKLKQESEEKECFQVIKNKLCPVIESTISELKKRTGFELKMDIGESSLVVKAPHPRPKRYERDGKLRESYGRISDHHFILSSVSNNGKTVYIEAIRAGVTNRNPAGWEESGLGFADYFGSDEREICARNDIDMLVSEDIHLLLEWLVRLELHGESPTPKLFSERQREEQLEAALFKANGGLACGIIGIFVPFSLTFAHDYYIFCLALFFLLGPISLYLGLHANSELSSLKPNYGYGRDSAQWAIALGICECVVLIVYLGFATSEWLNYHKKTQNSIGTQSIKLSSRQIPFCAGAGAVSLNLSENRATVLVSKSCLRTRVHTSGCGQLKIELPDDKSAQYYVVKGSSLIGPISSDQQADHQFNFGDNDFYITGYDGIAKLRFLASEKNN